jgi:HD-GYP domain-containing protein (c-di-GMP phosphodiesterase class II)
MSEPSLLPLLQYIIGMYDPYGVGHSARVKTLCLRLARLAGIEEESQLMTDLGTAADLHDIGKIGIPEYIRRLPGQYLAAERMLMEQHPIIGEKILLKASNGYINADVCKIVRHHHENWSGNGYPDGLKEDEIPLASRIIRICDWYDARTNVRGYQSALDRVGTLQHMTDHQIQIVWADPELLRLFLQMMTE